MIFLRWMAALMAFCLVSASLAQGTSKIAKQIEAIQTLVEEKEYDQAERKALDLLKRLRGTGPEFGNLWAAMLKLAQVYEATRQHQKEEAWIKKAIAAAEAAYGPEHQYTAVGLNNLGEFYRKQDRRADAEPVFKRALSIFEKTVGADDPNTATVLNNMATSYRDWGRYADAESLYKRALAIREKRLGPEHPDTATTLNNLAGLRLAQGRFADAEPLFKRGLAIREKALGPGHPDTGISLNNLALLYMEQGRYADAERLYERALALREKVYGPEHPEAALSISNLATLYLKQGRDAEALLKRALAIREKALGSDHLDTAASLNNLAMLYGGQDRYVEARPLLKRALAIYEKVLGREHPDTISILKNLGGMYDDQGRYAKSEPILKRALAIREKALGLGHPDTASSLFSLAGSYWYQDRYADALPLFERALAIREKTLGDEHPDTAKTLTFLARSYAALGRDSEARPLLHRAMDILARRQEHDADGQSTDKGPRDGLLLPYLGILTKQGTLSGMDQSDALVAAQLARRSSTANAFAALAQRLAAGGSGELAQRVRDRQELSRQLELAEKLLIDSYSLPTDKRPGQTTEQLRAEAERLRHDFDGATRELVQEFPAFAEFEGNRLADVPSLQKALQPNEALLAWIMGGQESYLLIVHPQRPPKLVSLPVGQKAVTAEVLALRDALALDDKTEVAAFPAAGAARLFAQLFGNDWDADLAGIEHLFLVPEGALTRLPFSVLLTSPPADEVFPANGTQYAQAPWLIRRFGLSVLPSISALTALRGLDSSGKAQLPFLGIGDPLLKDHPFLSGQVPKAIARPFRSPATGMLQTRAFDRAALLRLQPSLPDTADELARMAKALGANEKDSLLLRDQATESVVKRTALDRYAVISFATHGVLAGQLGSSMEAGLILTPPARATEEDDGYLTVSKIAKLRLNADWVILSACNTAGGDANEAEGLSGLAKAFIYAGAKALFVSHWAVDSEATTRLTGHMFRAMHERHLTRAEAHRQAILAMLRDDDPDFSHPSLWAPFIVVGDGGRRPEFMR